MSAHPVRFLYLNLGHFLSHYLMLVFATIAALQLTDAWDLSYSELIPCATPGFVAFGLLAFPAGWLADRWSRPAMMVLFFIGLGSSAMFTATVDSPAGLTVGLTLIGAFAAIYHPVGLALVVQDRENLGLPLAVNGVFGNLGVAFAALISGLLLQHYGWRSAYLFPGIFTLLLGVGYFLFERRQKYQPSEVAVKPTRQVTATFSDARLRSIIVVIVLTTILGGLIFQSTTFSLPRVFAERLPGSSGNAGLLGAYSFVVFAIAAIGQLAVGYLIDRYPLRRVFLCLAVMQCLLFAAMVDRSGLPVLYISIAFMLMVFGEIPISDVLIGRVAHGSWHSRAYALNYLIGFGVSASSLPLIAWIHAGWGFDAMFALLAVAAALICCVVLFLPETRAAKTDPDGVAASASSVRDQG